MKRNLISKACLLGIALLATNVYPIVISSGARQYHINEAMIAQSDMLRNMYSLRLSGEEIPQPIEMLKLINAGSIKINRRERIKLHRNPSQEQLSLLIPVWQHYAEHFMAGPEYSTEPLRALSTEQLTNILLAANFFGIKGLI